jgi:hypothetical protein
MSEANATPVEISVRKFHHSLSEDLLFKAFLVALLASFHIECHIGHAAQHRLHNKHK